MMPWFFEQIYAGRQCLGWLPIPPHYIGVPTCFTWYSNHVSRSLMEGLASRFLPSTTESSFSGSQKFTLLFGGLPGDWDCTLWGSMQEAALTAGSYSVPRTGPRLASRSGPRSTSRLGPRLTSGPGPRSTSAMAADSWPSSMFIIEPLKVTLEGFSSLQGSLVRWPTGPPCRIAVGLIQPTLLHGHLDLWHSAGYICLCNQVCREESISCIALLLLDSMQEGDLGDLLKRYMLRYTSLISFLDVRYPTNSMADWSASGLGSGMSALATSVAHMFWPLSAPVLQHEGTSHAG